MIFRLIATLSLAMSAASPLVTSLPFSNELDKREGGVVKPHYVYTNVD